MKLCNNLIVIDLLNNKNKLKNMNLKMINWHNNYNHYNYNLKIQKNKWNYIQLNNKLINKNNNHNLKY